MRSLITELVCFIAPGFGCPSIRLGEEMPNSSKFFSTAPTTIEENLNKVKTGDTEKDGHMDRIRGDPIKLGVRIRVSLRTGEGEEIKTVSHTRNR